MFSSKNLKLFSIFETDAQGPCKILSEYRVSRDSSQVQAVFKFFRVKNIKFSRENLNFTKNMQATNYAKAVRDWVILPNPMQSKHDFTKNIFRSVSNNNPHT